MLSEFNVAQSLDTYWGMKVKQF